MFMCNLNFIEYFDINEFIYIKYILLDQIFFLLLLLNYYSYLIIIIKKINYNL